MRVINVGLINTSMDNRRKCEKERKKRKKDYIDDWFRFVELTNKYLKQKLN